MPTSATPTDVALIYPHQLFPDHPAVQEADYALLVEEPLFFTQYPFHKKKLVLHRASMRWYRQQLDVESDYIEHHQLQQTEQVFKSVPPSAERIHIVRPTDDWLVRRLERGAAEHDFELVWHPSPLFYLDYSELQDYFDRDRYLLESFYRDQRRASGILMEEDDTPAGGEWNFDQQNRRSLPKDMQIPARPKPSLNSYVREAVTYVEDHFGDHYGSTDDFFYPVTRPVALQWMEEFFQHRFARFGPYQDAISSNHHTLFHSMLSPMLNVGLLTPGEVLREAVKWREEGVPINSVEGFVRQILGWREFMRLMYHAEGVEMRTRNFFDHERPMPESFWTGQTGIPPVDDTIRFVRETGYAHHIERLMVLANFMLLCEIDPTDVYEWFMSLFIDAYDWVMVPNVYDMGLFASGGIFATKPYISSSNYIRKMSDYTTGKWSEIWDGLYWRFIHKHQDKLRQNHRMGLILAQHDKMNSDKLQNHLEHAEQFLQEL